VALAGAGHLNEAVRALETTLSLNPNYFSAHLGLAKIYTKQTKYKSALREYRNADQLGPGDQRVTRGIANVQAHLHTSAGGGAL
jgi:Tfp pilus assembly protein PilF